MTSEMETVEAAVSYLQTGKAKPKPANVVSALLTIEKQHRKEKKSFQYEDLLGYWRLGFVSGTKKVRSRPNALPVKKPGSGRFLPNWVTVEIAYSKRIFSEAKASTNTSSEPNVRLNSVKNSVTLGPVQLCLTGPTRFRPKPNALAFDFTNIAVSLGDWTPYSGAVRGGDDLAKFKAQSLKDQAFFTFFIVEEQYIAARGKGGGLALWTRSR